MRRQTDGFNRNDGASDKRIADMNIDDLLIAIIIAGIGLSGAYLRAEVLLHRRLTAAKRSRELVERELHNTRVRLEQKAFRVPARPDSNKRFPGDEGFRSRLTHLLTETSNSTTLGS